MLPRGRVGLWLACGLLVLLGGWHAAVTPLAPLKRLEWLSDDLRTRALAGGTSAAHPDIVIVDIDDASLRDAGRWPWGRDQLARLSRELLGRQQVAALGFDLVFAEPDDGGLAALQSLAATEPGWSARWPDWQRRLNRDTPFAQALTGHPVVLGWYLNSEGKGSRAGVLPAAVAPVPGGVPTPALPLWTGYAANLPVLAAAVPRAGFFNALPDDDGVVRSVAAVARVDGALYESLAVALWRQATGGPAVSVDWRAASGTQPGLELAALRFRSETSNQERRVLPDERGALRVPYRGTGGPAGGSFRYISASEVLMGQLAAGALAGRIVLVGSSAPGLADLRATPLHPSMPGVEVHAHLLAGLLDGDLPQRPSWASGYEAVLIATTLVAATALAVSLPAPLALAGMALFVAGLVLATAWAQASAQTVLPLASALILGGLQFMLAIGGNYLREWRRRRSVVALFGTYLSPERVRQVVRQGGANSAITAENRELSILFCDLQGFSGIAERLPPLALRDLLNRYFSEASAIVHAHGGTLDKFIGDAVMAFWGAPLPQADHAVRSVRAAMALAQGLGPLNQHLAEQQLPPVNYGIGLATGLVCVGDLGSRQRRSYTAVGDAVNLAARLESLTREAGASLLVADTTRAACAQHMPDVVWLEVDVCRVKGREQPVTVFTPLQPADPERTLLAEQVDIWHLALHAAAQQHVENARAHLARLNELTVQHPHASSALLGRLTHRLLARLATAGGVA
ncbi:MAG: adenylate/guanylate cyclase domain-containing protein [Vitreoscilla sp.]|nr:adenylate/guanylate cyclase domain-containing protein [Vitreoscilla sp.]